MFKTRHLSVNALTLLNKLLNFTKLGQLLIGNHNHYTGFPLCGWTPRLWFGGPDWHDATKQKWWARPEYTFSIRFYSKQLTRQKLSKRNDVLPKDHSQALNPGQQSYHYTILPLYQCGNNWWRGKLSKTDLTVVVCGSIWIGVQIAYIKMQYDMIYVFIRGLH